MFQCLFLVPNLLGLEHLVLLSNQVVSSVLWFIHCIETRRFSHCTCFFGVDLANWLQRMTFRPNHVFENLCAISVMLVQPSDLNANDVYGGSRMMA